MLSSFWYAAQSSSKAQTLHWLCVTLSLLFMGKSKPQSTPTAFARLLFLSAPRARPASVVTSPLTIKHVLFNQALGVPVAVGSLQGVIGTVGGR